MILNSAEELLSHFFRSFVCVVVLCCCCCVCVLSFSLEDDDDARAEGRRKSGCLLSRKIRKKRKKREKERETRFNWPESPFTERKIPFFFGGEIYFFFSFLSSVFFFLPELIKRPQTKKSPLSLSHNRRENTLNTKNTTTEEREREKRIT